MTLCRLRHNVAASQVTDRLYFSVIAEAHSNAVVFANPSTPSPAAHNLCRIFLLRGFVFLGLATVIVLAGFWLDAPPPIWALWVIAAASAVINLLLWQALDGRTSQRALFAQLLVDLVALAALLYFAGGATNPFVWLLLLPLAITATVLPKAYTWTMAITVCGFYSLLMGFHRPIPGIHLSSDSGFALHIVGMWIGFIVGAAIFAYFLSGMAENVRFRDQALARAREQVLRDEKLVSLGTLAAGAAHELGTPLGTMSALTDELEADLNDSQIDAARRKLELMSTQIERCKKTIAGIASSAGIEAAKSGRAVDMNAFIEIVIDQWHSRRSGIHVSSHIQGNTPGPRLVVDESLTGALINLFDNAADASPNDVDIEADWNDDALAISVSDRGNGFAPEQRARIGKTLFSSKAEGHGLGLYLAHGVIDRLGGTLSILPRNGGGTIVEVQLPLGGLTV